MDLYVIVLPAMNGSDAARVFADGDRARACLRDTFGGNGHVAVFAVSGVASGGSVYAAHRYIPGDLHDFIGLYADYETAHVAAGPRGVTTQKRVDQPEPSAT